MVCSRPWAGRNRETLLSTLGPLPDDHNELKWPFGVFVEIATDTKGRRAEKIAPEQQSRIQQTREMLEQPKSEL